MINNYLDWAKRQRKYAIQHALMNQRRSKTFTDPWAKGFYIGLGIASSDEAHRWRKLQKDIESRIAEGWFVAAIDPANHELYDILA